MSIIYSLINSIAAIDPVSIVKDAYDKDFRWWFLVLLALVLAAGLWAFKYLLTQAETQRAAHGEQLKLLATELTDSRRHHHDRLEAMQVEAFRIVKEVTAVIAANNIAIDSNTRESEKVRTAVERWDRGSRDA